MGHLVSIHDKKTIEAVARRNPYLHLYELGDLDDFFWPSTVWYGWEEEGEICQLALLYVAPQLPVLLALPDPPHEQMSHLLRALVPILPRRFYAHLDPELARELTPTYTLDERGLYWKMGLTAPQKLAAAAVDDVVVLTAADLPSLEQLYRTYPDNHFDPRMVETGRYYGIYADGQLASVAGIHVYSQQYRVASLGNITTHPAQRGRGYSTRVCAMLCQQLVADGIETIILNVNSTNSAAIAVYQKVGFSKVAEYGEFIAEVAPHL